MYKIIIYSSNLDFIKCIYNNIITKFKNFELIKIATNKNDLEFVLSNISNIDMIFLTYNSFKNHNLASILNNIKYKIVFCDNLQNFKIKNNILYVSNCSSVINELKKFTLTETDSEIREKIIEILEKLNFDFKLNGTNYLLESILYSYINKDNYVFENLEKNVYPYIAQKYNINETKVKYSIIRSINNMNLKLSNDYPQGSTKISSKITAKLLISEIINKLLTSK